MNSSNRAAGSSQVEQNHWDEKFWGIHEMEEGQITSHLLTAIRQTRSLFPYPHMPTSQQKKKKKKIGGDPVSLLLPKRKKNVHQ